jgi:hypothetical protein
VCVVKEPAAVQAEYLSVNKGGSRKSQESAGRGDVFWPAQAAAGNGVGQDFLLLRVQFFPEHIGSVITFYCRLTFRRFEIGFFQPYTNLREEMLPEERIADGRWRKTVK